MAMYTLEGIAVLPQQHVFEIPDDCVPLGACRAQPVLGPDNVWYSMVEVYYLKPAPEATELAPGGSSSQP